MEPNVESLLTKLADELLVKDITEPSAVLATLSDDELEAAYDFVLEHFALELLIGADKNSDWSNGKLVIDANHGPIHLLQTAFYAVRLEVSDLTVIRAKVFRVRPYGILKRLPTFWAYRTTRNLVGCFARKVGILKINDEDFAALNARKQLDEVHVR